MWGLLISRGGGVVGGCRGTHQSAPGHASRGSRVSVLKKASITALPPQCPAIDLPGHLQCGPRTSNLMRALNHAPGTLVRCLMHQHVEEAGDQLPILHSKLVWACTDCPDNAAVELERGQHVGGQRRMRQSRTGTRSSARRLLRQP